MILKELKFNNNPLCYCEKCHGLGVTNYLSTDSKIGVICESCGGMGFESMILNDKEKLYIDEEKDEVYLIVNGVIKKNIRLFKKRIFKPNDFAYVIHGRSLFYFNLHSLANSNSFLADESSSKYCIPYIDFMNGKMPKSPYIGKSHEKKSLVEDKTYEVTDNIIELKYLMLGKRIRCNCSRCSGTGLYWDAYSPKKLGTICYECFGRGWEEEELDEFTFVAIDTKRGLTYYICNGSIYEKVELFVGLKKTDEYDYVMFDNMATLSYDNCIVNIKDLFKLGISKDELISYRKFLIGRLPLPMEKYSCPYYFTRDYTDYFFDNDCYYKIKDKGFTKCPDYESGTCWKMFYGDAKTAGKKQEVLRRLRKK